MIRLEHLVMYNCMRLEGVAEIPDWAVHHIPVKCPFEKGGEDDADGDACGAPDEELNHGNGLPG